MADETFTDSVNLWWNGTKINRGDPIVTTGGILYGPEYLVQRLPTYRFKDVEPGYLRSGSKGRVIGGMRRTLQRERGAVSVQGVRFLLQLQPDFPSPYGIFWLPTERYFERGTGVLAIEPHDLYIRLDAAVQSLFQ